jgi:hypothetical protein
MMKAKAIILVFAVVVGRFYVYHAKKEFERRAVMRFHRTFMAVLLVILIIGAMSASATTIDWTIWTTSSGEGWGKPPGSAAGATALGITVNYTGQIVALVPNYPSWNPASTFSGGTVDNPPPQSGGIIELWGGFREEIQTITFSSPVTNPVMAIWSLGSDINQSPTTAEFDFDISEPFTIQSGGPSFEYPAGPIYYGDSIYRGLTNVYGQEGSGTIQFQGTFSSITFRTPDLEIWYGFTVGVPVPEPGILILLGISMASIAGLRRWWKE